MPVIRSAATVDEPPLEHGDEPVWKALRVAIQGRPGALRLIHMRSGSIPGQRSAGPSIQMSKADAKVLGTVALPGIVEAGLYTGT
jgi:hypothetical protein